MLSTDMLFKIIQHTPDYNILHTLLIFFFKFHAYFQKHRIFNEDLIQSEK